MAPAWRAYPDHPMTRTRPLTPEEVIEILRTIEGHEAILIGGQSLNVLALFYLKRRPSLKRYEPYASEDIDFLTGDDAAAHALADRWSGAVRKPDPADPTPNLAVAQFALNGEEVEVDFLNHVLGFATREALWRRAITIAVPLADTIEVNIRLLHPIDCLASRILNLEEPLCRADEQSLRQAQAALEVAIAFIDEKLSDNDLREGYRSLRQLHRLILQKGIAGRHLDRHGIDLLETLAAFRSDARLDVRFRRNQIESWIQQIEDKRRARQRR